MRFLSTCEKSWQRRLVEESVRQAPQTNGEELFFFCDLPPAETNTPIHWGRWTPCREIHFQTQAEGNLEEPQMNTDKRD